MNLRLEKNYTFVFEKRSSIWTKDFLLAFALAIALHFFALVLFRIDLGSLLKIYPESGMLSVIAPYEPSGPSAFGDLSQGTKEIALPFQLAREQAPSFYSPLSIPQELRPFTMPSLPEKEQEVGDGPFFGQLSLYPFGTQSEKTPLKASGRSRAKIAFIADVKNQQLIWFDFLESSGDLKLDKKIQAYLSEKTLSIASGELFEKGIATIEFGK